MKIICLSYFFPPMNAPRATQVERLVRFSSLPLVVWCAAAGARVPRQDVNVRILPDKSGGWWRMIKNLLYLPDAQLPWAIQLAKRALREQWIECGDLLITFGQPMSDHMAGLYIKNRLSIRWIAHLSDPWSDNLYQLPLPFARRRQRAMEASVFSQSDRLLFTSKETVELVMCKYSTKISAKVSVLPHAFDSSLFDTSLPVQEFDPARPLIIRHLGNFYLQRNPRTLLLALRLLLLRQPEVLKGVRFELIGRGVRKRGWSFGKHSLPDTLILMQPSVSYGESLRLMCKSDLLLVIDAPSERSVFFPSKLVDYLGANRPILALTPLGTTARIVASVGGHVIDPGNPEKIAAGLAKALQAYRAGELRPTNSDVRSNYDIRQVVSKFDHILCEASGLR